jgi:DNA invertase Pin-like site-specific DNA recombinase
MIAHRGKFVSYVRVSTDKQGRSGLGLEAQRKAVADYLNGGSWELVGEFQEVESGKNAARPELQKALAACKKHRATLVIAKLDRLSRNVAFIANLMESGVQFVACDAPHATKFNLHILAAVAEFEREQISKRTRDAMAAAKARGQTFGGPNLDRARQASQRSHKALADQHAANVAPIIREVQRAGLKTYRKIADALNARGVGTARGGAWHASTVRNVLRRT